MRRALPFLMLAIAAVAPLAGGDVLLAGAPVSGRAFMTDDQCWEEFLRLAPSPAALRRSLIREMSEVEFLSGEDNLLTSLGDRLRIRVEADSWAGLLAKTKPSFAWHDGDLLWVGHDAQGHLQFTLDEARLYQPPGEKPRWVLIDVIANAPFDEVYRDNVMGRNLRAVAKLKERRPQTRDGGFLEEDGHGIDGYAIMLGRHPRAGAVYEVGWEKLMSAGVAHPVELRKVYLRRDPAGRWEFLGEGSCNYYDREVEDEAEARVEWVETKADVTPQIHFVTTDCDHGHFTNEDDVSADWRDVVMLEEHILAAPFPAQLRQTTAHPYLVAERGDTFEKIVEHLVKHQYGWMRDESSEVERAVAKMMCRAVLRRLNPTLPLGAIAGGTKIQVLGYGDLVYEVERQRGRW